MLRRLRRNRQSSALRALNCETSLNACDLIMPFFVIDGQKKREAIASMPGIERLSIDELVSDALALHEMGLQGIALFPKIDPLLKDANGSYALDQNGLIPKAIKALKEQAPALCIFADVALDPYTSHGHDGVIDKTGYVLNDETVDLLSSQALILADSGADVIAPSDMMDKRVLKIREALEKSGFTRICICSYTAKYASAFYGPFRDALGSHLGVGNKKTYQMDPANTREALLEAKLDIDEGADMLMVKPALSYLDVIRSLNENFDVPISAYQVSGEYAMIMASAEKGFLNADQAFLETLLSIKRAGANFIFSYATKYILEKKFKLGTFSHKSLSPL